MQGVNVVNMRTRTFFVKHTTMAASTSSFWLITSFTSLEPATRKCITVPSDVTIRQVYSTVSIEVQVDRDRCRLFYGQHLLRSDDTRRFFDEVPPGATVKFRTGRADVFRRYMREHLMRTDDDDEVARQILRLAIDPTPPLRSTIVDEFSSMNRSTINTSVSRSPIGDEFQRSNMSWASPYHQLLQASLFTEEDEALGDFANACKRGDVRYARHALESGRIRLDREYARGLLWRVCKDNGGVDILRLIVQHAPALTRDDILDEPDCALRYAHEHRDKTMFDWLVARFAVTAAHIATATASS